jgi:phenylalanyl-tRNA synthetase beta chain
LTAAGLRSINNIVDVTNYAMHELGQPLHAFDRAQLDEQRIVVRRARPGEEIETLDHVQRNLADDTLVIADANRSVGIAGVIGGFTSEVSESTTSILLESANFDMRSVRQTARALKLRTDASARFERGLDPNLASDGAARAVDLILQLCPEAKVTAVADVYPNVVEPRSMSFPVSRIGRLLGVEYAESEIVDALARLEFEPKNDEHDGQRLLTVQIPTYRRDVSIPVDIIEEVARVLGYERLPDTLPLGRSSPVMRDEIYRLRNAVRDFLVGTGGIEAVTYVTVSPNELEPFLASDGANSGFLRSVPVADLLAIKNPLQSGRNILRPAIVPSLLESVATNLKHASAVSLFESARVYLPTSPDELPDEVEIVAIATAGRRSPLEVGSSDEQVDFFDLKGVLDELWSRLGVQVEIDAEPYPGLHPGRAAVYRAGQELIGRIGELHPETAKHFGIEDARAVVAEIDLSQVLAIRSGVRQEITVPRYLPVEQDFAVVVDESTPAGNVQEALATAGKPLASAITLFDVYRGSQIGEGKKSLAFRITFTAPDRTLTDAELVKVRSRIEKTLAQGVAGVFRT